MIICLDVPDSFVAHYKNDRFRDSLIRINYDIKEKIDDYQKDKGIALSGIYEIELLEMLIDSFKNSKKALIYGFDIDDLRTARILMQNGITHDDLREHIHDYEYIIGKVRKEFDKVLNSNVVFDGKDLECLK